MLDKLNALKKEKNAIILAHNYQLPDVQDAADLSGDSLELARAAADVEQNVIVFCGVHFMAETAVILSPEKTVLLPDERSGCPMADMATADQLRELKAKHPGAVVVCYVNSTAEVKAESDVCCTSSNAVAVVNRIPAKYDIIFVPDKYLGGHVERMTGRQLIKWDGYCPTHAKILVEHIERQREAHAGAPVLVHPECRKDVCLAADEVFSTGQMVAFAKTSKHQKIIVGTEIGLLHRLRKENPQKEFVSVLESATCPNMKRNTVSKIIWSLEDMTPQIKVDQAIAGRAKRAVVKMFEDGPIVPLEDCVD